MAPDWPSTNPDIRITEIRVLSDNWYVLRRVDFEQRMPDGSWTAQQREAYDRGNGAVILLVDWDRETVVLTRQFRAPAYLNGSVDGMLIEAPAGLLDDDDAATAIRREAEEETGIRVGAVRQLFDLYMSPGSVTERVVFFTAEYGADDRVAERAGVAEEGESIAVLEVALDDAVDQVATGVINDGKTVILLQWAAAERERRRR
ncbi:MAG: NUDIX domain-containing protein [Actinomycetota bacterium]